MTYQVALTSLGCSKNLVDSEVMLGLLQDGNYVITDDFSQAEVILVNTCGFILPAKQESIDTILKMAQYKEKGKCRVLVVTGCLVQKYGEELVHEIPEIDGTLGTADFYQIVELVNEKLTGSSCPPGPKREIPYEKRLLTTPGYIAFVKIAEGCDHRCAFCVIPQLRGPYLSRTMESIVAEVRKLIALGIKEINLVAQDTTYYGMDLYGEEKLAELLDRLARENIKWIRVLYCYPARISDRLLDTIAKHPNICKYLDIPIQHADDLMLKRMGRKENRDFLIRLMDRIRKTIPDVALRTTLMVGFPGETEKQFNLLLDFLSQVRFDWVGAFIYSREDGTRAGKMRGQIPQLIKEERYHRLMSAQAEISLKEKEKWIGKTISALVEGKSLEHPEYFIGRSQYQAPEVDGVILVKAPSLKIGDMVPVNITGSDIYDLIGEIKKP